MKLIVALVAASAVAGVSVPAIADHAAGGTNIAVYRGPASCEDCSEALARGIAKLGSRYRVTFIGPNEHADVTPATLARFQVYVQPGGGQDIDAALASLGPARVAAIRRFVTRGGSYLGVCMGAYLAGASDIGLIGDDLDSEVRRPGFPVTTINDSVVPCAGRDGRSHSIIRTAHTLSLDQAIRGSARSPPIRTATSPPRATRSARARSC